MKRVSDRGDSANQCEDNPPFVEVNMRWVLAVLLVVLAAFCIMYRVTTDAWAAANVAGILSVVYMAVIAIGITHLLHHRRSRIAVGLISFIALTGLTAHWIIMWRMTDWQYDSLQRVHLRLYHEYTISMLSDRAASIFREYKLEPTGTALGASFLRKYPPGTLLIDSLGYEDGTPVIARVSDSAVTLLEESRFIRGLDSTFVNEDGKHGLVQHRVCITPTGVTYDIQN